MTNQQDFLKRLIEALNHASIPYMLSGSMSSSFHGQPRATNDFDIVIAPTEEQLSNFVRSLGEDYYVSSEAVKLALKNNSMFNIIDHKTGAKADLILCKNRAFSREEFQRRRKARVMELDISIVSPEDVILIKLEWAKDQKSQQQFSDALGVAIVQWENLNLDYLHKWAKQLHIESPLSQLLEEAKKQINTK